MAWNLSNTLSGANGRFWQKYTFNTMDEPMKAAGMIPSQANIFFFF
jgi:hypothetical protein